MASYKSDYEQTISGVSMSEGGVSSAPKLPDQFADESYKLFSKVQVSYPTPEEARKIRNKCLWRILPFLCVGYHVMYVDKQTLGSSAILGIMEDANLTSNQYNWLSSIFYFGYMLAEWPQNWSLQRFPAVMMPIMWSIGNASPITSGLLSYGVLWIRMGDFAPWRWFMVITGLITIIFGTFVWFFFPDSPLHANFLTDEERAQAVLRIQENHSGIEQKRFKKYQFIEALKDPKTWLFFLHAWSQEMANGLTNQYSLLINSFGFTVLQTTLLGTVTGVVSFVSLGTAAIVLAKTKNCRAWISIASYVPAVVSSILLLSLPWSNRWGLIVGIWLRSTTGIAYAIVMIWAANASAGHTKKTTVIALYHIGIYLSRENHRRDQASAKGRVQHTGVVESFNADGIKVSHVVDNNQLDLTDRENLAFRYVL
ncbi:hypothetical protein FE257_009463 [Aspergillus nanangensis]|uniref:Uncharacterized protein n=1 Tax=Aspergillus nanangensis TaxID=2582783 RepID=A0AAD4CK64_ASPNN|nr:hypothetical protein FE257_009463 [Aspergillus nanangensis]